MNNGDNDNIAMRTGLRQLADHARSIPRRLPSDPPRLPDRSSGHGNSRPVVWRAAASVVAIASVVGGLLALSLRDQTSTPADTSDSPATSNASTTEPVTAVAVQTTVFVDGPGPVADPDGLTIFGNTTSPISVWPTLSTSGLPMTNLGYGMTICDSGTWTKYASLVSPTGTRHEFQGTLCTMTTLDEAAPNTVATCAAIQPVATDIHYAPCATVEPSATPVKAEHPDAPQTTIVERAGLTVAVTPTEEEPTFSETISARSSSGPVYQDAAVTASLSPGKDDYTTCFAFDFQQFSSSGCLDYILVRTGLAFGAFRDGDGPIDLVGIVPDDVASVVVAGSVVEVRNNIWHITVPADTIVTLQISSADGSHIASAW